jgi:hypothetical protein
MLDRLQDANLRLQKVVAASIRQRRCVRVRSLGGRYRLDGGDGGGCVEVARNLPGIVTVRDSKNRSGPVLTFAPDEWAAFTNGVRDGQFDLS